MFFGANNVVILKSRHYLANHDHFRRNTIIFEKRRHPPGSGTRKREDHAAADRKREVSTVGGSEPHRRKMDANCITLPGAGRFVPKGGGRSPWRDRGGDALRSACWDHLFLDDLVSGTVK